MPRSRSSAAQGYEPQHPAARQEYSVVKGMSQGGADMEERWHTLAHAGASNLHRRCSSRENSRRTMYPHRPQRSPSMTQHDTLPDVDCAKTSLRDAVHQVAEGSTIVSGRSSRARP